MLGIFTMLPFIVLPYILYEVFSFVIDMVNHQSSDPEVSHILTGIFAFIFPIILLSILSLGLLVLYIVHAASNKMIDSTERIIWILIFIFFGVIAFPIYWFLRIWNEGK
ncbi:MAG: hypothetical protein JNM57_04535 [Cyclobacteriaceae bacterium]|nr:hypothetical protein [Cyclobacteriaceae bacterium]